MKLPIVWLNDYINKDFDIDELENSFTLSGTKVEEIIKPYDKIKKVYTGKIREIKAHKDADKLVICDVDMGDLGDLQIVTAATNMKEGDIVPVAMHKARLFDGYQIKKGKLRGEVSEGMFCSLEELGLEEEDQSEGILIL
ncbi:MAG: phenylalanine--tRNA ligase subunit beta, partial [Clostridium sp.]|nr:phenylalanine--tRNA ligase subunit beta [Clostridium sp.]